MSTCARGGSCFQQSPGPYLAGRVGAYRFLATSFGIAPRKQPAEPLLSGKPTLCPLIRQIHRSKIGFAAHARRGRDCIWCSLKNWKEAPERPVFTFPLLFSPNNWTAFVVIVRLCGHVPGAEFIRTGF
ncbi:hypothetical protein SAMCFNEI73_pC1437 (plasmid) [Sinorhizobium americanum]|uniref:Uncharacterized protein n=1 Tax=Sinorhizobium americanum TaxID=194963 RepID=A0A1L3LYK5_9HYPH|nr:hypothetical protein SAMCFNEI73_pC1437 [Sinorhizobium americanum]